MIVIDLLFYGLVVYIAMILLVMFTSKGECFFCGKRFGKADSKIVKIRGRKWCGCDIKNGEGRNDNK